MEREIEKAPTPEKRMVHAKKLAALCMSQRKRHQAPSDVHAVMAWSAGAAAGPALAVTPVTPVKARPADKITPVLTPVKARSADKMSPVKTAPAKKAPTRMAPAETAPAKKAPAGMVPGKWTVRETARSAHDKKSGQGFKTFISPDGRCYRSFKKAKEAGYTAS